MFLLIWFPWILPILFRYFIRSSHSPKPYLVGGAMCPSWKNDGVRQWVSDDIPFMKWKIKTMFETTNQIFRWDMMGWFTVFPQFACPVLLPHLPRSKTSRNRAKEANMGIASWHRDDFQGETRWNHESHGEWSKSFVASWDILNILQHVTPKITADGREILHQ